MQNHAIYPPLLPSSRVLIAPVQCHYYLHLPRHVRLQLTKECVRRDLQLYRPRHLDNGRGKSRHHQCLSAHSQEAPRPPLPLPLWQHQSHVQLLRRCRQELGARCQQGCQEGLHPGRPVIFAICHSPQLLAGSAAELSPRCLCISTGG